MVSIGVESAKRPHIHSPQTGSGATRINASTSISPPLSGTRRSKVDETAGSISPKHPIQVSLTRSFAPLPASQGPSPSLNGSTRHSDMPRSLHRACMRPRTAAKTPRAFSGEECESAAVLVVKRRYPVRTPTAEGRGDGCWREGEEDPAGGVAARSCGRR